MNRVVRKLPGFIPLLPLLAALLSVTFSTPCPAQNLLFQPESIVYDPPNHRYLVSNWGSGDVVQIDSTGTQSIFLDNQRCYAGLQIVENTLYVACREYGVKGFDLTTREQVLDVDIPGTTNINDITADTSGNLYVSYPTGGIIYKIRIESQSYTTFVGSGLNTPNGILFDAPNNRLLVVSYRPYSPIQAVSLEDSSLSTVVTTSLHNLDGLTRDAEGNYYVSSWYSNACYRFDSDFSDPPVIFSNHSDDPADIFFNTYEDVLAVPLFFTHGVEFVSEPTPVNEEKVPRPPRGFSLLPNFPNPFNPSTTIAYHLPVDTRISLRIFDLRGREIRTLVDKYQTAGSKSIVWDGRDDSGSRVASGIYFYRIESDDPGIPALSRKMLVTK